MYPLFQYQWIPNFTRLYPNIGINAQNTGSAEGQAFVEKGNVIIGGSAAFLTNDQQAVNPNILNIALSVTADIIDYNIIIYNSTTTNPPVTTRWGNLPVCKADPPACRLNFTATLLTQIYNSTVVWWDDHRIKDINPGAARFLPHEAIYATYRSDGAGDTLFFTQYLASADPWAAQNIVPGLTVTWPNCVVNATIPSCPQSALGNPGIVIATGARAGALSYVSVEALDQWVLCKTGNLRDLCSGYAPLDYGLLENQAGNFVEANYTNIQRAINATASQTPSDERFSLANAPGNYSYPIVGYGYALVNRAQLNPDFALVLRTFLRFCLSPTLGSSPAYLGAYHFNPLPPEVLQLSLNQTALIGPYPPSG